MLTRFLAASAVLALGVVNTIPAPSVSSSVATSSGVHHAADDINNINIDALEILLPALYELIQARPLPSARVA